MSERFSPVFFWRNLMVSDLQVGLCLGCLCFMFNEKWRVMWKYDWKEKEYDLKAIN
jgi:hypothetical protein